MSTRPRIAIALGDSAGIGPEIALKTALDERARQRLVADLDWEHVVPSGRPPAA